MSENIRWIERNETTKWIRNGQKTSWIKKNDKIKWIKPKKIEEISYDDFLISLTQDKVKHLLDNDYSSFSRQLWPRVNVPEIIQNNHKRKRPLLTDITPNERFLIHNNRYDIPENFSSSLLEELNHSPFGNPEYGILESFDNFVDGNLAQQFKYPEYGILERDIYSYYEKLTPIEGPISNEVLNDIMVSGGKLVGLDKNALAGEYSVYDYDNSQYLGAATNSMIGGGLTFTPDY